MSSQPRPESPVDRIRREARESNSHSAELDRQHQIRFERQKRVYELWGSLLSSFRSGLRPPTPCHNPDELSQYCDANRDEWCGQFTAKLVELGKVLTSEGFAAKVQSIEASDDAKVYAREILLRAIDGRKEDVFDLLRDSQKDLGVVGVDARQWVIDGFAFEVLDIIPPRNGAVNSLVDFIEWLQFEVDIRQRHSGMKPTDIDDGRCVQEAYSLLSSLGLRKDFPDQPISHALTFDGVNALLGNLQSAAERLLETQRKNANGTSDKSNVESTIKGTLVKTGPEREIIRAGETTTFQEAAAAAIGIVSDAVFIVQNYSTDSWWIDDGYLTVPSSKFGHFLGQVCETDKMVHAVAAQLIDAKRDDQPVRFGCRVERTAHQVAVKFARRVGFLIYSNLWTDGPEGPTGTGLGGWPKNGLMSDEQLIEFQQRWRNIRDDLAKVELGNLDEIIAVIKLEAQRAVTKSKADEEKPIGDGLPVSPHKPQPTGNDQGLLTEPRVNKISELKLSLRKAISAYLWAQSMLLETRDPNSKVTDQQAYDYIKEHGLPDDLEEYRLPENPKTFSDYCVTARGLLNINKNAKRETLTPNGKTVVRREQIDR